MKHIKTVLAILLLIGLLLGCSSKSNSEGEKVVIDIFNPKSETKDQLDSVIEEYERNNENVDIKLTTVGAGQNGNAALQAKFSSGEEPEIFILSGLSAAEKYKDYLSDVSDMEAAKTAVDGTLQGAIMDDIPYGIPLNIEGFGWMINKEIFNSAGVDPSSISSYDDFKKAVETIDSKKTELGIDQVFGFVAEDAGFVSQYTNHFTAPEFNNDLKVAYEADELNWKYGDRMKEYTDLINQYNVQPIISLDYSTSVEELFANNKVAIINQGNWIVPTLDSMDPSFSKEKLGILPFFVDSDTEGYISAGPSWYWFINKQKDEKVVEESKKFLDWMYTSDYGKQEIVESFKYIPAHQGYDVESIEDPVSKEIYQMLVDGKTRVWVFNQYPDGFYSELHPHFQKYLVGDITWKEFNDNTIEIYEEMRSD